MMNLHTWLGSEGYIRKAHNILKLELSSAITMNSTIAELPIENVLYPPGHGYQDRVAALQHSTGF